MEGSPTNDLVHFNQITYVGATTIDSVHFSKVTYVGATTNDHATTAESRKSRKNTGGNWRSEILTLTTHRCRNPMVRPTRQTKWSPCKSETTL